MKLFERRHPPFSPAGNVTIPIAQSDISTNSLLGKFNGIDCKCNYSAIIRAH